MNFGARVTLHPLPSQFAELAYSSDLLLYPSFPDVVLSSEHCEESCRDGFDCYFQEMYKDVPGCFCPDGLPEIAFEDRVYTFSDMSTFLHEELLPTSADPLSASLARRAGFCLGWLSALALTDRDLALQGLGVLTLFVLHQIEGGVL